MITGQKKLTETFKRFFASEQASGIVLIACTLLSLAISNSPFGNGYLAFWQTRIGGLNLEHWINDGLMAIFFLFIGLELERELYVGELSNFKHALLPMIAAIGGMVAPAAIHYLFNAGAPTQGGFGIPMATDIAFAVGVLAILGSRIPPALKVFVVAFAVMDDLGAIIVIAAFYTADLSIAWLVAALAVWGALLALNVRFRVMSMLPYLIGGAAMWAFMLKSGVHATLAGVLLAFAIPFSHKDEDRKSPSHRLEHLLHKPVAFVILPIFALANTCIVIGADWFAELGSANSLGILAGLALGKPLGVTSVLLLAVAIGVCALPASLRWTHVIGAGLLGGIGFTMSIFITNLAFPDAPATVNAAKIAILLASLVAGVSGMIWLGLFGKAAQEIRETTQ
ncbi:MAG: Na+/H+ antiporter NhaA [Propionivibrio sp.]